MTIIDRVLRRKSAAPLISHALVNRQGDLIETDAPPAFRSALERDFRALQSGAAGVSDYSLNNLAQSVVVVFTCLEYLANKARMVPLKVETRTGETEGRGPFAHFMHNEVGGILSDCTRSLSLWGKAFLRKHYNPSGYPTGLEFINPNNIDQRTHQNTREILGYWIKGTREELRPDEVIYLSRFSYSGDGNPLSPTEAAFINGGIQSGIASYAVGFFFNDAVPAGIVSFNPPISPPQFDLAKRQWKQDFRGAAKAHKTAFTNGAITFTPITQALKDMAMQPLDDGSKQKICAAFLINPAAVGLGDVSQGLHSRSTFEDAVTETLQTAVLPVVRLICEGLTEQWAQVDFSPPDFYRLVPDTGAMPELSAITSERVSTSISLVETGSWDYDEQRAYLGMETREDSDERLYLQAHSGQPLQLFNDGGCSLKELRMLVGLPAPVIDYWKLNGKSVGSAQVVQYIAENSLVTEVPASPYGLLASPSQSMPNIYAEALADVLALPDPGLQPELETVISPSRAKMQAILAVDFGGHNLIKMARRALGKVLDSEYAVSWVPDNDWRLDLLALDKPTPASIATLMQQVDLGHRKRIEFWTAGYQIMPDAVYLALVIPDSLDHFQGHMSVQLNENWDTPCHTIAILGVKLCDMPGVKKAMLKGHDLTDFPLVVDNLSLYVDGQKRQRWDLERVTDTQRTELRNWQHKVTNAQKRGKEALFNVESLPQHVVRYVESALQGENPDYTAVFTEARNRLDQRAIQATRLDYEGFVEDLLRDARSGKLARRRFGTLLRAENARYVALGYRDGLIDGGVLDGETDTDDERQIKLLTKQANTFVTGFSEAVYNDGLTDIEAAQKPALWYRAVVAPAYNAGLLSADANGMYEFTGLPGADSCVDCVRLEGQVHRLKAWAGRNLLVPNPGNQKTECGGWQCNHVLAPTKARAKGNW